jgi:tetratricopeptide (TPR) repeat protein
VLGRLLRDLARQWLPSRRPASDDTTRLDTLAGEFDTADRTRRAELLGTLQTWVDAHPAQLRGWVLAGDWLTRLGRLDEAESAHRRALRLDPNHAPAQEGIGLTLLKAGRLDEAYLHLETAHKRQPMSAEIMVHWGLVALEMGQLGDAARKFQGAIDRDPRNPQAWHNLALVSLRQGDAARGIGLLKRAIDVEPGLGIAHSNLALAYRDAEQLDEGLQAARSAVALKPRDARSRVILADLLTDAGDFDAAAHTLDEAGALDPGDRGLHLGRAKLHTAQGRLQEAEAELHVVLSAEPDEPEATGALGQLHLLTGRFESGWDLYEARLRSHTALPRQLPQPVWQGEPLDGRTLLVQAEQGLGDVIFFSGCLPDVQARAGHVVLETYPRLATLMQRSFPSATVVGRDVRDPDITWLDALPPIDLRCHIASLPRWLRRKREAFTPHNGYLVADAARTEALRQRLAAEGQGPTIGIAWRGGLTRTARLQRSVPLEALLRALGPTGARLVNLQHGEVGEELAAASAATGVAVTHWPELLTDQDSAAALTSALQGVVTVCQTQAHLTGALALPGCVLVPRHPNWRYGLDGPEVPWYPSLRLMRQSVGDDWLEPLQLAAAWVMGRGECL